jgi:spore germination cell wall hydrolase CwlJ-like protein
MTDKTKRRLCGAAAAGYLVFCTAVPVAKADATTYWWGVTAHTLTESERDLAERIVMAEAGGESYECMLGVAQTIRERSEHWGMTVEKVLTAKAQYAKPYKGEPSEDAKEAVSAVFDKGERAFDAYTTHFHDDSVDPWWNRSKEKRGEIDGVLFWGADVEMR